MFNHILHWFTIYIRRWENFSDSNSAVKKPYTILNPLIPGMQRVTITIHSRLCGNINTSNKWIEKFFKQNIHLKYLTNTGSYTLIYVIKGLSTDYSHHVSDPEVFCVRFFSLWCTFSSLRVWIVSWSWYEKFICAIKHMDNKIRIRCIENIILYMHTSFSELILV